MDLMDDGNGYLAKRCLLLIPRVWSRNSVNLAYAYVSAVVKDGDQVKTGHRFRCVPDWDQLRLAELAREAAGEGLSLLNAQTVPSGSYRIILRRDVARDILATFSGVFSADAVQKGFSLLGDKLGDQIAAEPVTLVDNPLLPKEGGSRPFDGEGVAVKQTNVISRGQLVSFLHNLKTARKAGVRPPECKPPHLSRQ